eukprot:7389446-Prymnesium_polylepis.1
MSPIIPVRRAGMDEPCVGQDRATTGPHLHGGIRRPTARTTGPTSRVHLPVRKRGTLEHQNGNDSKPAGKQQE